MISLGKNNPLTSLLPSIAHTIASAVTAIAAGPTGLLHMKKDSWESPCRCKEIVT